MSALLDRDRPVGAQVPALLAPTAPRDLPEPPKLYAAQAVRPNLVVVGGVPGAGKTTVLAWVAQTLDGVRVIDPERHRIGLARAIGAVLPYRAYRPLVHLVHAATVLALVARGPRALRGRILVVHEPATRPRRNAAVVRFARARGWRTALVYVDVPRAQAVAGQHARGRVVDPTSFAGHWQRWAQHRERFLAADRNGVGVDGWEQVHVVRRHDAQARLHRVLTRG